MRTCVRGILLVVLLASLVAPAAAQEFRGRLTGTVTDNTGAILPGVTVTASSPALIQPQTTVTGQDGSFRMIGLPAGSYVVTYDLPGFQGVRREDIRVVINTTLTLDAQLNVATVQESVTVSGASPVIDTSTTTVGTNFVNELLTEIPNARDVWAAMAQAPGFAMTGYDVGGSHTGTQTGYSTYGVSQQNTTRIEGVNTTEGVTANAGYFDFGSFEELQLGGAGNMADQDVPGASMNITVKSGGDRFSGTWYSDYESDGTITDNVPDYLKTPFTKNGDGFFTRTAVARGNPIDRQYDINLNIGGPLWKRRAWFFYSYRLNDQYKTVLNFPDLARSKLSNPYTVKGTFQLSRNNQFIGYFNKREKLQALRDIGANIPLSAAYFQASRNYPMKAEWTSILSSRMFLDVLVGQWYNFFPLRPQTEVGVFPVADFQPSRTETSTGAFFAGTANRTYQNQNRMKPQFHVSMSLFQPGWRGGHDFKFGFEARRDRRVLGNDQPFNIHYRETNGAIAQVDFFNGPVAPTNDVNVRSAYIQDNWKFNDRLTLNLGLRIDHYTDGWPDQEFAPSGVPALSGSLAVLPAAEQARISSFFAARTVDARIVSRSTTLGPRAGFTYDLKGTGKSVIKGYYGRFYFNSADLIADNENPVGFAQLRYAFVPCTAARTTQCDLNGNKYFDGPAELGAFVQTLGGGGFVKVDPNLKRPYGDEISTHFEQEVSEGLSARASYVYKNLRNEWAEVDVARVNAQTVAVNTVDRGPDGILGNADDRTHTLYDIPAGTGTDRVFTNPTDPAYDSDYHTLEFALNRRFRNNWMLMTGAGYTWANQFFGVASSTGQLDSAGNAKAYNWNRNLRVDRETSTGWGYKLIGRYVARWDIGISGSYKLQSGRQWGRAIALNPTGFVLGSQTVRVEPVTANRAPSIDILDLRLDKTIRLGRTRLIGTLDIFNLMNANEPITFRTLTGNVVGAEAHGNFKEVTALLDPRIIRFGFRYEF